MSHKIQTCCKEFKMSNNSKVILCQKKICAVHLQIGSTLLQSNEKNLKDLLTDYASSWAIDDEKTFSELLDSIDFANDSKAVAMLQSVLYSMDYFFIPIEPMLAGKIVRILNEHNQL